MNRAKELFSIIENIRRNSIPSKTYRRKNESKITSRNPRRFRKANEYYRGYTNHVALTEEEKPLVKGKDYFFVANDSLCYDHFVFVNYKELVRQGLKEEADLIHECSSNEEDPDFLTVQECWNRIMDNFVYRGQYYLTYHGEHGEDLYAVKIGKSLPDFWECEEDFWDD